MKKLGSGFLIIILLSICLFALSSCQTPPPGPEEITLNCLSVDFEEGSINIQFDSNKKITEFYYVYKTAVNFDFEINVTDTVDSAIVKVLNSAKENGFFERDNCQILLTSSATDIAINVLAHANVRCVEFFDNNALKNTTAEYFVFNLSDTKITTVKDYGVSPALFVLAQSQISFSDDSQYVSFVNEKTLADLTTNIGEDIKLQYDYFSYDYSNHNLITYKDAKYTALWELKEEDIEAYFFNLKYRLDVFDGKLVWIIDLYDKSDDYRFFIDAYEDEILKTEYHVHTKGEKFEVSKTSKECLEKALEHALVSQDKLSCYTIKLEKENDNLEYYSIKFSTKYSEFEYKVNANTAEIEEYYFIKLNSIDSISKYNIISYQNAVESALVASSVTDFKFLTVELAYDGVWFYRVEFYKGQSIYYIEVNAYSGAILYSEINGTTSEEEIEYISIREAKQSVYDDASRGEVITDSEVENLSVYFKEMEIEGVDTKVYVVEFLYKDKEYSYVVDATDGIVLERFETPLSDVEISTDISEFEAIQTALSFAGANVNEVSIDCELKSPVGRNNASYHLNFSFRGNIYYFIIDAETGFIVEFSIESTI